MQFYSILDLLKATAQSKEITLETMYKFFQKKGIKKKELEALSDTSYFPNDKKLINSLEEFTGLSELEISLSMGFIPPEYSKSYYSNIKKIADILERSPEENYHNKEYVPYFVTDKGKLFNEDCVSWLKTIPDNSVDLIFADPPFNLDKDYGDGISDKQLTSEYINWTKLWLEECVRVLKPGAQLFVYNLPKWSSYIASYLNQRLTFRNWIAINMKFSLPINGRLYPAHYGLLCYVKGVKPNTFNPQRLPAAACRHCGGELADYGGYKNKMNPNGINVSDVWDDIYPVRHKNSKNRKSNELSLKLLERIIEMASNPGDLVLDPFGGSGTTYVAAELLERNWLGCELGDCEIIKKRMENPEQDLVQHKKILSAKNKLFTDEIVKLRIKNKMWLPSDFK